MDTSPEPADRTSSKLGSIVARCIVALEEGDSERVAEIRRQHPDLADDVSRHLHWLGYAGLLSPEPVEEIPDTVGAYRIVEEIGRGGMGAVYLAEQSEPVRRRVALKILKLGMDSAEIVARFEAERQALALMSHENIAQVYDAGLTPRGQPFFAMELVPGKPITDYCDDQGLTTEARLELLATVCDAVQHAHQKGVIHRDLKPSNILVVERDGKPVPKVIDFGVAKSAGTEGSDQTMMTAHGELLGTPEYMSPEQAAGEGVDTRTDVYALGVVLYELLTGSLPFPSQVLRRAAGDELKRILLEEAPEPPSTRVGSGDDSRAIAARRGTVPADLRRHLRGDLDLIAMTAMDKDRERRYATPSELGGDLRRFLRREPILAAPPGFRYRCGKFVARHRVAVTAAALLLLLFLLGSAGTAIGFVRASRNLATANKNLDLARGAVDRLLTRVANAELEDVPRTLELRRDLLADALEFHRAFLENNPGDLVTHLSAAAAMVQLAIMRQQVGDSSRAESDYAEAETMLRQLVEETDDPEARFQLAKLHRNRMELNAFAKRDESGRADFEAGLALLERLDRELPDQLEYLKSLASLYQNHALLLDETGQDSSEATSSLIRYRERLAELQPDSLDAAVELAVAQHNRAITHIRDDEAEPATELLLASIEALDRAVEQAPDNRYYREMRANTLITIAEVSRALGNVEQSARSSRTAIADLEKLIEEYPSRPDYRHRFGMAAFSLARTDTLDTQETTELLEQARGHLQEALNRNPENQAYRFVLSHIEQLLESRRPDRP